MALFQRSVLSKFLKQQDTSVVSKAYKKFSKHFHNTQIQDNIRNSKEEQYQEGFLRELFVDVLGYTLNPQPKYNLTTELKNEKGAKKVDGAILNPDKKAEGNALGVIELKGTDTKDLEKVRQQAFDYKANQTGCVYVITSNFEKLRFYVNNAVEWEEFDLFTLTEQRFELLYLCLAAENLLNNVPLRIKEASIVEEENITKKFYSDYSLFKRELYRDLVKENMRNEIFRNVLAEEGSISRADKNIKLRLFKKSQKLIDRFLFIFFAEDRGLLPPNSTLQILDEYDKLKSMDAHVPLYNRFKLYFTYLDQGRKGTPDKAEIFAYNGGLFKPDTTLDSLLIDDELLYKHARALAKYDFESQVDVNILGHIFENSLNEIESVNAEIEGVDFDKQKTKRKKDGVFYTPKYITKYIVDNTVGKLCKEKKAELGVIDEEYTANRQKETKKKLLDRLEAYRSWLLEITICDPACGSGAFLNQALDFLINEHRAIDELQTSLLGGGLVFPDIENTILEKNIYGVDLNEESIEIAKLSLWLRTAQPRRKLNDLNNNIKCGNSLIDSKTVAGEKAFSWEKEFPEVFEKGGFDVIIGNPPYVDIKALDNELVKALFKAYNTTENRINLYSIFIEKGFDILKSGGYLSFINPNSILVNSSYTKIRKLLLDHMTTIIKLPDGVFEDAIVETIIFEFRKNFNSQIINTIVYPKNEKITHIDDYNIREVDKNNWKQDESWNYNIYVSNEQLNLLQKVKGESIDLGDITDFTLGITPYDKYKGHSSELIKNREYHSTVKIDETYKPLISGANIQRYSVSNFVNEYIKYGDWLGASREERFFMKPRVLVRQIVSGKPPRIYAGYSDEELYYTQIGFGIIPKKDDMTVFSLLGFINSKLLNFYHQYSFLDLEKELFQKILIANCKKLPIKKELLSKDLIDFDNTIENIILLTKKFNDTAIKFNIFFTNDFKIESTRKLDNWQELNFKDFIKELNKAIKKTDGTPLTKLQEMEWMEVFETKKKEALELKAEIDKTDKEIDQMVYELYGLNEEEIKIVEGV